MKRTAVIVSTLLIIAICLIAANSTLFGEKKSVSSENTLSNGTASKPPQWTGLPSKNAATNQKPLNENASKSAVLKANEIDPICNGSDGGRAGDTGLKVWCWGDIDLPEYSGKKGIPFSSGQLHIDSECYEKQITKVGNQLSFRVDPLNPEAEDWCANNYNMRAEIRTAPWNVRHPQGTEEWFGWSYTLGEDYKVDVDNEWMMFQVYPGPAGLNPQMSLQILSQHQIPSMEAGTLCVVNSCYPQQGSASDYTSTGIIPVAGQQLDIVIHVIWGDASESLLQVWINGETVYDKQVPTVLASHPWGGNAKWGVYKFPWRAGDRVQQSIEHGITGLQAYMGPLRIITRGPEDAGYGENSYAQVVPR